MIAQVPELAHAAVAFGALQVFEVHDEAVVVGWQLWQALEGLAVPDAYTLPPIRQPDSQVPAEQYSVVPQLVPSARFVHPVVLVPGWQLWHLLVGLVAPDVMIIPLMSHCFPHCPAEHICELPHPDPSCPLLHVVVLALGLQS
jgi:hypothetical protein